MKTAVRRKDSARQGRLLKALVAAAAVLPMGAWCGSSAESSPMNLTVNAAESAF